MRLRPSKWWKWVGVCLTLLASPLQAKTYWVSPTGDPAATGADSLHATTLATANANMVAGDVCFLLEGTYSDPIQPAGEGKVGSRISYYGSEAWPNAAVVAGVYFGLTSTAGSHPAQGDSCTAAYVAVANSDVGTTQYLVNGLTWYSDVGDSLKKINLANSTLHLRNSNNIADSLTIVDTDVLPVVDGTPKDSTNVFFKWVAQNCQLSNSHITASTHFESAADDILFELKGDAHWRIFGNTINLDIEDGNQNHNDDTPIAMYNCQYMLWQSNYIAITDNGHQIGGANFAINQRDYCTNSAFINNIFNITSGTHGTRIALSNSASVEGTVGHNRWQGNAIFLTNTGGAPGMYWQDGARGDTIRWNAILVNDFEPVLGNNGAVFDSVVVSHNDFSTLNNQVIALESGDTTATHAATSRLASNIYYGHTANDTLPTKATVTFNTFTTDVDSSGLFFDLGGDSTKALYGYGGVGAAHPHQYGHHTWWGPPGYIDSSFVARLQGTVSDTGNLSNISFILPLNTSPIIAGDPCITPSAAGAPFKYDDAVPYVDVSSAGGTAGEHFVGVDAGGGASPRVIPDPSNAHLLHRLWHILFGSGK